MLVLGVLLSSFLEEAIHKCSIWMNEWMNEQITTIPEPTCLMTQLVDYLPCGQTTLCWCQLSRCCINSRGPLAHDLFIVWQVWLELNWQVNDGVTVNWHCVQDFGSQWECPRTAFPKLWSADPWGSVMLWQGVRKKMGKLFSSCRI